MLQICIGSCCLNDYPSLSHLYNISEVISQYADVNILYSGFVNPVMYLLQGGIQQVLLLSCGDKKKDNKTNTTPNINY